MAKKSMLDTHVYNLKARRCLLEVFKDIAIEEGSKQCHTTFISFTIFGKFNFAIQTKLNSIFLFFYFFN